MRRREYMTLLGGAAATWPVAARAQPFDRMRRIGVLRDPIIQSRISAFQKGLQELGWSDGRNVRIDWRWGAGDLDRIRAYAAELITGFTNYLDSSIAGKWLELLKEIAPGVTR